MSPDFEVKTSQEPVPGSSKEANASPDISLFNRLPPEVFGITFELVDIYKKYIFKEDTSFIVIVNFFNFLGLTDWEDSHILSQVLATSQQEYLDSLKQSRVSADGANTIESSNSAINNS